MKFPVLVLGKNEGIDYCASNDGLSVSTNTTLKSGILLQNIIVDCNGHRFEPKSITKERRLKFSLFLDHLWKVRYDFRTPPVQVSLDDLKHETCSRVLKERTLYEEVGDVNLLLEQLNSANSFIEVISLFGPELAAWKL